MEVITGKSAEEKERFRKQIKPNMDRAELLGILSSIRGTITLTTSVNTIRNSLMCGAGLASHAAPYIGMDLTGVAQELDAKRDEIQMAATQMVLINKLQTDTKQRVVLCHVARVCHFQCLALPCFGNPYSGPKTGGAATLRGPQIPPTIDQRKLAVKPGRGHAWLWVARQVRRHGRGQA